MTLNEALSNSLARVNQHIHGRNIGIITAHRGEFDAKTNKERNHALASDIRKAGYGFAHIRGRYIENHGTKNARPVDEHSFLVVGKKGHDSGNLKGFLRTHGNKYGQDSILHKSHDSEHANLIGTKEGAYPGKDKEEDLGKFHANRFSEFHSVLKHGKTFAFANEEWHEFVAYHPVTFSCRREVLF